MISRVRLRPLAEFDLEEIAVYLGLSSAPTSGRFVDRVVATLQLVVDNPRIVAAWPTLRKDLLGMRRFPVSGFRSFLIFYIPDADGIDIVRILHGSRDISGAIRAR